MSDFDILKRIAIFSMGALLACSSTPSTTTAQQPYSAAPWENVLYGAPHYNEYMPADLLPDRLDKDVALMKQAGSSVVRMGESTWSLWEPEDGCSRDDISIGKLLCFACAGISHTS